MSSSLLNLILGCFFGLTIVSYAIGTAIERVDDSDLIHLLTNEDNVVVFFTKSNCPECDELENILENICNELEDTLGAVVVKAQNSHMVNIYDPSREPSLIYFRRGIPLLYHGELAEDAIIYKFNENREPVVKELSDSNFEHLTQAATGATTGDWFVFFYSADCVMCQRLYAVWEAVGAHIKRRQNVARVNRLEGGAATAKRFAITGSPEFILLRQGKVYRYKSKNYTPKSFIDFVENEYRKQTDPEIVPPEHNIMDNIISSKLKIITTNNHLLTYAGIVVATTILLIILCKAMLKKKTTKAQKNK